MDNSSAPVISIIFHSLDEKGLFFLLEICWTSNVLMTTAISLKSWHFTFLHPTDMLNVNGFLFWSEQKIILYSC